MEGAQIPTSHRRLCTQDYTEQTEVSEKSAFNHVRAQRFGDLLKLVLTQTNTIVNSYFKVVMD